MLEKIYLFVMFTFIITTLYFGFMFGFRPITVLICAFSFFLWFPILAIFNIVCFVYFICIRLIRGKWIQKPLTNFIPFMAVFVMLISILFLPLIGTYTAYHYAGFDNLRKEADILMARASQNTTELSQIEYPKSFRRIGATRVFFDLASVEIRRGGLASYKEGVIIYANNNHKAINSGDYKEYQVSSRIFSFDRN